MPYESIEVAVMALVIREQNDVREFNSQRRGSKGHGA